jgi:hypothetical protein
LAARRVWVFAVIFLYFHADAAFANNCKEKAYVAGMKSDLRNVITAQEAWYADHENHYAPSIDAMGSNYKAGSGVTVTLLSVDSISWSAHATHVSTAETCDIVLGTNAAWSKKQRENEGVPLCTGRSSSSLSLPPIEEIAIALAIALVAVFLALGSELESAERTVVVALSVGLAASVLIPRTINCGWDGTPLALATFAFGFLLVPWCLIRIGVNGVKAARKG